ncbi:MAG: hypothetical protein R3B40_29320, partial [Polyangiales bacterium]
FREKISPTDLQIPSHLVPLQRNGALEEPSPPFAPAFRGDVPDLSQDLPEIPDHAQLRDVMTLTGRGGGQGAGDVEWPVEEIAAYLRRHHPVREAAGREGRWTCDTCYQRSKGRHGAGLTPENTMPDRHRVGPTRVESPNDAATFADGMRLMARVYGLDPALYVVPIDIGQDDRPRPGRRGRIMGDVMPHWARVVQLIRGLHTFKANAPMHQLLSFVAMASHGWIDGTQLGLCMTPSHHDIAYLYSKRFLYELAQICTHDVVVIIYGCSAGGETNSFGSRSIARWIGDQLRAYGVANPRVDAHTEEAHAFTMPSVRRFEPGRSAGGGGGMWIVPPPGVDFDEQKRGELVQASRLRSERLRESQRRAQLCINGARRRSRTRRHRPAIFTAEDYRELVAEFARANELRSTAVARRASIETADSAGRSAIAAYRVVIRRYHELLVERGAVASNGMLEAMRQTDAYDEELPSVDEPEPQTHDQARWDRWRRAYRLVLDGVNFCSPLMTLPRLYTYLDALPDDESFERALLRMATPDRSTQHFWFFGRVGSRDYTRAPAGGYLGTVPGAYRRPRRLEP